MHFHQLSSSDRYFCGAREEIRLLNYSFSQASCHSALFVYRCSIKGSHCNHLSFTTQIPFFEPLSLCVCVNMCVCVCTCVRVCMCVCVLVFFHSPTLSFTHPGQVCNPPSPCELLLIVAQYRPAFGSVAKSISFGSDRVSQPVCEWSR